MKVIRTRVSNCVGYIISSKSRKYICLIIYIFFNRYISHVKRKSSHSKSLSKLHVPADSKNFIQLMKMKIGLRNSSFHGPKLPTSKGYCTKEIDEKCVLFYLDAFFFMPLKCQNITKLNFYLFKCLDVFIHEN